MIRKLRLENFQGFRSKTEIELAPITLIFGPNSSGKSSLIKGILLLKQTLHRPLENGDLNFVDREVDLGSFLTVVYGHDSSSDISLGLSLENKRTNTQFDLKISDPGFVN
jgi:AAA15 family ATPase/GTPase